MRQALVLGWVLLICICIAGNAQPVFAQDDGQVHAGACVRGPCAAAKKCDQDALKKAKAEYDKWVGVWQDQSQMADRLGEQVVEVYGEGNAVWDEQFSVEEGLLELNQETGFHLIEKEVAKMGAESMAHTVDKSLAAFTILKMLSDMTAAGAKMISKIIEAKQYATQGASTAQAEEDTLQHTKEAKEKLDQLEAACNNGSPPGDAKNPLPKADNKRPGTDSHSWQAIAAAADDAINQMNIASNSIEQARTAVQSAQGASSSDAVPGYGYSASLLSVGYIVAKRGTDKLPPATAAKFELAMTSAYKAIAKAGQDWDKIGSMLTAASAATH